MLGFGLGSAVQRRRRGAKTIQGNFDQDRLPLPVSWYQLVLAKLDVIFLYLKNCPQAGACLLKEKAVADLEEVFVDFLVAPNGT